MCRSQHGAGLAEGLCCSVRGGNAIVGDIAFRHVFLRGAHSCVTFKMSFFVEQPGFHLAYIRRAAPGIIGHTPGGVAWREVAASKCSVADVGGALGR